VLTLRAATDISPEPLAGAVATSAGVFRTTQGRSEHQPDHSNEQLFDHEAGTPSAALREI
jgi:hypothetical protein